MPPYEFQDVTAASLGETLTRLFIKCSRHATCGASLPNVAKNGMLLLHLAGPFIRRYQVRRIGTLSQTGTASHGHKFGQHWRDAMVNFCKLQNVAVTLADFVDLLRLCIVLR